MIGRGSMRPGPGCLVGMVPTLLGGILFAVVLAAGGGALGSPVALAFAGTLGVLVPAASAVLATRWDAHGLIDAIVGQVAGILLGLGIGVSVTNLDPDAGLFSIPFLFGVGTFGIPAGLIALFLRRRRSRGAGPSG